MKTSKTILIVEDTHAIRVILTEALKLEDYNVISVANGKAALDFLAVSENPSLIFLDFYMPVMNGREFLERLRADDKISTIPVVLMSANAECENIKEADFFVKKPFDLEFILQVASKYSKL